MSNGINARQNEENSIAMLAAQRQLYRDAKWFNTLFNAFSVWFPFLLAVILLFVPENVAWQYASYIIAIGSMVFSFVVDKLIDEKKELAAFIQQKFDVYVYSMPWNNRVFGQNRNVNHKIVENSRKILSKQKEKDSLYNWYTPAIDNKNLLEGILFCQKENYWWDVGLRKRFRAISILMIIVLGMTVFMLGLLNNESVAQLLGRLVFVVPMISWLLNTVKQLNKDIKSLNALDGIINDNKDKTMDDLQDIQRMIYEHRKGCYAISDFIYKLFKDNDEDKAHREACM